MVETWASSGGKEYEMEIGGEGMKFKGDTDRKERISMGKILKRVRGNRKGVTASRVRGGGGGGR